MKKDSHITIRSSSICAICPVENELRGRFLDETSGELTQEAIAGDRAMREFRFDASMRMGYYGLETMD